MFSHFSPLLFTAHNVFLSFLSVKNTTEESRLKVKFLCELFFYFFRNSNWGHLWLSYHISLLFSVILTCHFFHKSENFPRPEYTYPDILNIMLTHRENPSLDKKEGKEEESEWDREGGWKGRKEEKCLKLPPKHPVVADGIRGCDYLIQTHF